MSKRTMTEEWQELSRQFGLLFEALGILKPAYWLLDRLEALLERLEKKA
jgi:hypothetical protein